MVEFRGVLGLRRTTTSLLLFLFRLPFASSSVGKREGMTSPGPTLLSLLNSKRNSNFKITNPV